MNKIIKICLGIFLMGNLSSASMLDSVIYSVVGQVANATGARLGDEIYYGSSKSTRHTTSHRKHRKRKKHHKSVVITPEMKIQQALSSLGFYRGKIDGQVNSYETRSAIKAMNVAFNMGNTASLSPEAKDALVYLGTLFRFDRCLISQGTDKRSKGKKIQTSLKIHGFYFTKIDGAVGAGTRRCIGDYKLSKGLSSGQSLDFEEEYQLVSSAKAMNDKDIDNTINNLKRPSLQHMTTSPQVQGQQQFQQQTQPVQKYIPQGQQQNNQYVQPAVNVQSNPTMQHNMSQVPNSSVGQQVNANKALNAAPSVASETVTVAPAMYTPK